MPRLLLFLGLLALFILPVVADDKAAPPAAPEAAPLLQLPVPDSVFKDMRRIWYGVYINGSKSGWACDSHQPAVFEGHAVVTAELSLSLDIKAMGNLMKMSSTTRTHYSAEAPYRALYLEEKQTLGPQERRVVLRWRDGKVYAGEVTEAGKTKKVELADLECFLWQATTPEVWAIDPARKVGDTIAMTEFSSEHLKMTRQSSTILRPTDWAVPGGKVAVWEMDLVDLEEGIRGVARISRVDGSMISALIGPTIEMRAEPEKVAKTLPDGGAPDIFTAFTIAADRPLAASRKLSDLVIELTAPEGKPLPKFPDTANQTVEKTTPTSVTLHITRGAAKPRTATDAQRADALKSTPRYPIEEEAIQKLAARAVNGAKSDREKVEKLLAFTDFYVRDSMTSEPLTVMDLIKDPKGDCSAHALLFVALARAAGVPAREAGGWVYMGNEYKSFGGHAWNEVILDGAWVPVDPLWGEMQLDAGHIQDFSGESAGKMIENMVPGLKAKVISFETK